MPASSDRYLEATVAPHREREINDDEREGSHVVAGVLWAIGMGHRIISATLRQAGLHIDRATIWREGKRLIAKLEERGARWRRGSLAIAGTFPEMPSCEVGVIVTLRVGARREIALVQLREDDPLTALHALAPLLDAAGLDITPRSSFLRPALHDLIHTASRISRGNAGLRDRSILIEPRAPIMEGRHESGCTLISGA